MPLPSRAARVGDQIREELSRILLRQAKDPRVSAVTLTRVRVTADLQLARVYFRVLGDAAARRRAGAGLDRAAPFLRRAIAQRLRLRRVPDLRFIYDDAVEQEERIEQLLDEIRGEQDARGNAEDEEDHDGPEGA